MLNHFGRMLCGLLCAAMVMVYGVGADAAEIRTNTYISAASFDASIDYFKLMKQCANDGSNDALEMGLLYETLRNLKIDKLSMSYEKTSYFTDYCSGKDILAAMDMKSKIDRLKGEHQTAGVVYEYLHQRGFTDAAIAGILGNMMAECGGQTLDLQWSIYGGGSSYYGLCQWSLYYNPNVNGRDVLGQLDYLMGNIEGNMKYFGGDYHYFRSMTDAGEAAGYFLNYYERGSGTSVRKKNAYTALVWING